MLRRRTRCVAQKTRERRKAVARNAGAAEGRRVCSLRLDERSELIGRCSDRVDNAAQRFRRKRAVCCYERILRLQINGVYFLWRLFHQKRSLSAHRFWWCIVPLRSWKRSGSRPPPRPIRHSVEEVAQYRDIDLHGSINVVF